MGSRASGFGSLIAASHRALRAAISSVRESACYSRAMLNITTLSRDIDAKDVRVMASSSSWC
jgi:hypothetical protein